ncbi:alcohol dehydrogenase catalytic domain-containing protein [Amycolatopsis pithecellobii]|uniref:alcohol dehydrogenase catalytic domain-containing protein n=1 Tax=Amycolatopsis pithecellobii TaxID=664692 RepID=UPI0035E416A4
MLVQMVTAAVCGSDLHRLFGHKADQISYPGLPGFPGHEGIGQVVNRGRPLGASGRGRRDMAGHRRTTPKTPPCPVLAGHGGV